MAFVGWETEKAMHVEGEGGGGGERNRQFFSH